MQYHICYEDSTSTLWDCKHRLCHNCSEMMLQRKQMKCPLCREKISYITDKETGNVKNLCGPIELIGAAYYLDVCIYAYYIDGGWMLFSKGWPKYDELDMQNEKCIYLYMSTDYIGIITDVTNP